MQNQASSKKNIIIAVVIIALVIVGFIIFKKTPPPDDGSLGVTSQVGAAGVEGVDMLAILNELKALHFDTQIFNSTSYASLNDFSIQLVPQPVGRDNPFAPTSFSNPQTTKTPATKGTPAKNK